MNELYYDPIGNGDTSWINTPYQYWKGCTNDTSVKYIEFAINGKLFTVNVDRQGNWEFQLPGRLLEGNHNLSIRYFDYAGNPGLVFQRLIVVDLSPPDKPDITTILDDVGPITGPVGKNGLTDDTKPTIKGYAEPDSIVRVYSNDRLIGSVKAAKNGAWQLEAELGNGVHNLTVTATDRFDQVSEPSDPYPIRINVTSLAAPELVAVIDNQGPQVGVLKNGDRTDDKTPLLSGNAPADAVLVNIYVNGKLAGVTLVTNGQWSWESTTAILQDGDNSITLRSQNARGELSAPTAPFTLSVGPDAIEVSTPVIYSVIDDVGSITGNIIKGGVTDDKRPTLHGTADGGSLVTLYVDGKATASVRADASGRWSLTPSADLSEGLHRLTVGATNSQGYSSPQSSSWDIIVDTIIDTPTIDRIYDDIGPNVGDLPYDGRTDDLRPDLFGKAEPGSLVNVWNGNTLLGSVTADSKGNWKWEPDMSNIKLTWGTYNFSVSGVDAAGNVSGRSGSWKITIGADLPPPGRETFDLNPHGNTNKFIFTLNTLYTLSSGLKFKMTKVYTNSYKDMREGFMELGRGSETQMTFKEPVTSVKVNVGYVHKAGSYIDFYDNHGKLLYSQPLDWSSRANNQFDVNYNAPSGSLIGSMVVRVSTSEVDIAGSAGGVRINDLQWNLVPKSGINMLSEDDTVIHLSGAEDKIDLSRLVDGHPLVKTVDLSGHGNNTLKVDIASVLQHGAKDVFIADGKTQMMINGDKGDVVQLQDLLPSGQKAGSWGNRPAASP